MKRYRPARSGSKSFSTRKLERKSRNRLILTLAAAVAMVFVMLVWILPIFISSLSIINKIKPASKSQPSIAENATLAPPVLNIPYEATNTAAIAVKGYSLPKSKVEIYLDEELSTSVETDNEGNFLAENIKLLSGTNNITGIAVDEKGAKSLPSKNIRIIFDDQKPKLDLSSPSDDQTISGGDKKVLVSGNTDPGSDVWAGEIKVIVDFNGNFSQSIDINEGENQIAFKAADKAGNVTTLSRKVTYKP